MKLILVVDDMAIFREPIAACLQSAGYDAKCAADGEEALKLVRRTHPDLVLLDLAMPGVDGIAFLRNLRGDPSISSTRVVALTAMSEKNSVLAARTLGVTDYILKARFRLDDLLTRIRKFDAPPSNQPNKAAGNPAAANAKPIKRKPVQRNESIEIPKILSRDQFLERVEHAFQAKTLSGVVAEVIAMASSARGDTAQLASLISRDPMLSARVLQTANSASYASHGAIITTISDAIRKVGYTAVRNIAAALGIFDCLPEGSADGFNPIRCWQHSFAVAQLCEKFAMEKSPESAGLAYVVGLCHDLGDIFIHTQFNKEYQQLIELAAQTGRPKDELCGLMLGVTPAQMIAAIHKCMALPDAIRKPIELLHSPNGPQSDDPITRLLWLAENHANAIMLASSANSEVAPLTQSFCRAAIGQPNPRCPDAQSMRAEVLSLTVALARLSRLDEKKLTAPMFKAKNSTVWVAREPSISKFDPISLALESLAKTTINDRLPASGEAEQFGGLVVIASGTGVAGFCKDGIEQLVKKCRSTGRAYPVLMVLARDGAPAEQQVSDSAWRLSVTLSDLAAFAEELDSKTSAQAA